MRYLICWLLLIPGTLPAQRKDPGVATLWSVFLPGGGQIYAGETGKGIGLLVGHAAALGTAIAVWDHEKTVTRTFAYPPGHVPPTYTQTVRVPDHAPRTVALSVAGALWLYSLVDAAPAARRHDRRLGLMLIPSRNYATVVGVSLHR